MSTSKSIAQYRFLVRPNVEHLYRSALVGIAVVAFSSLAMAQNNNGFNGSFNSQPNGQQNGTVGNGAATNGNFSTQTNQGVGNQGVGNQGVGNQGVSNQGVSNQGVSNQGGSQVQPATNQSTNGLGGQVPLPDVRANPNQPLPRPFPELSQSHVQYLNQLLAYWETNSNKIKRYHCKYTNWTYNSLSVPIKDPSSKHVFAQSIEVGMIKFAG